MNENDLLMNAPLHWPIAKEWMWNCCIYLGPYTNPTTKRNYDLGVYIHPDKSLSAAVVYGDRPGEYISGEENLPHKRPEVIEAFKHAHLIGL